MCPLAIRFDNGCTSRRSIARFKCRAPYLESVSSTSKNSLAASVTLTRNAVLFAAAAWISGSRPDQFRDFMAVLKFRAIDFDYCTGVLQ
jgi:hypothetical protein